jgi:hypothetical protein
VIDKGINELISGIYMGKGIKRMKAYKSMIDTEELKIKRKEFWGD